jgi:hypothetical protein
MPSVVRMAIAEQASSRNPDEGLDLVAGAQARRDAAARKSSARMAVPAAAAMTMSSVMSWNWRSASPADTVHRAGVHRRRRSPEARERMRCRPAQAGCRQGRNVGRQEAHDVGIGDRFAEQPPQDEDGDSRQQRPYGDQRAVILRAGMEAFRASRNDNAAAARPADLIGNASRTRSNAAKHMSSRCGTLSFGRAWGKGRGTGRALRFLSDYLLAVWSGGERSLGGLGRLRDQAGGSSVPPAPLMASDRKNSAYSTRPGMTPMCWPFT